MTSFVGRESASSSSSTDCWPTTASSPSWEPAGPARRALAVELARSAAGAFADGVWFVPLDAISDPDLVGSSIVAALGLRDITGRTARQRLLDNLADRTLLLVLDNFEQVLAGAGIVGEILAAAPTVKAVATSRAPLRLAAERVTPSALSRVRQ
jgi:predicted ATPase